MPTETFALTPASVEDSDDVYLLTRDGDNVKIRDQLVDIKILREIDSAFRRARQVGEIERGDAEQRASTFRIG